MMISRRVLVAGIAVGLTAKVLPSEEALAASAPEIDRNVDNALRVLYSTQPRARNLAKRAKGILVFPNIVKAGLLVGGQTGDGALRVNGRTVGYYNISAVSFGLQAGGQRFSYALFFMTDSALKYLSDSNGWSVGSGPSVVVLDKGKAASLTSTTATQDVYAVPFGQKGLMAGLGLEGSKITHINPSV
jgi:lipid-binding SYLF domain-containing protein